jgi:hypothetical protein
MAVKDVARPAANAIGPNLCSATAAPNTTGVRGSTHGDRIENNPANIASGSVVIPMVVFLHGLPQKRLDQFGPSLTHCPLNLFFVPVNDERCDVIGVELSKILFVRVVVSLEDHHILKFGPLNKLRHRALHTLARSAPRRGNLKHDGFSGIPRSLKSTCLEWHFVSGLSAGHYQKTQGQAGEKTASIQIHL